MDPKSTATEKLLQEPFDFSLVLGGPLYQLYRRAHLSGGALELLRRRVLAICLFAWLPPLVLSILEGRAWGGTVQVPFLLDVHTQVQFLVVLPLFIVSEVIVHHQMRPIVRQFIERGLVPEPEWPRFDAAIASAARLRNSVLVELLLLAFVYLLVVLGIWRKYSALNVAAWYGLPATGAVQPTLAGWWFMAVSLPLLQFIGLRWYFRLFIWIRFLWQVARMDLRLIPTHPDQAGGLGFLANILFAFAPLLIAQSTLLAGWVAGRILFAGARLPQFKIELLFGLAWLVLFVLGPLLVFIPRLARTRLAGLLEYGKLASRYVGEFDQKWLRGGAPADLSPLGSADVQSLADIGNSFEMVRAMKMVPFGRDTLLRTLVIIVLPILPLTLSMISFEEVLSRFLKALF